MPCPRLAGEGVVFEHGLGTFGDDGGKVGAVAFQHNRRQGSDHDLGRAGVQGSAGGGPIPAHRRRENSGPVLDLVRKSQASEGFDMLRDRDKLEWSLEALVIARAEHFPSDAVDKARTRLEAVGMDLSTGSTPTGGHQCHGHRSRACR